MTGLAPEPADRAIATILAGGNLPGRPRVAADLSAEYATNRLTVGFEDCDAVPDIGDHVTAYDTVLEREATAETVGRDDRERCISIAIDWLTLHDTPTT